MTGGGVSRSSTGSGHSGLTNEHVSAVRKVCLGHSRVWGSGRGRGVLLAVPLVDQRGSGVFTVVRIEERYPPG